MSEELNLITFNAISKFVAELGELYGKKQRTLALYKRLIKKTSICNEKPIQKHISSFRKFCVDNREAIRSKNSSKLVSDTIKYSETAMIDMKEVFSYVDNEDNQNEAKEIREGIWKHILTISALVDPAGKAKEILKESAAQNSNQGTGQEVDFIANIIDKVENTVDPNANPMEAVSSIMQSGIFNDLITDMNSGLQNGNLDLGKLMGAVTGMVSTLGQQPGSTGVPSSEGTQQNADAMSMLNTMMGSFMAGMKPPTTQEAINSQMLPPLTPSSSSHNVKEDNMDDVE